jgi:predicted RNA binding protein YcfA (HicA-like mRNA interferase family)
MTSGKSIARKELIRKFLALGFTGPYSGGRHQFMSKGALKIRIPNPHGGQEIHIGLLKEILRQAGISNEEWDKV